MQKGCGIMQSVMIGNNQAGQRLDKFLHKYLPEAGTSFLYKMLRKKNITLNGRKAEGKEMLAKGDEVQFFFSEKTFAKFSGRKAGKSNAFGEVAGNAYPQAVECLRAYSTIRDVQLLYEDEHVILLNKPVGVLTQKASPKDVSLNEWLIGYLLESGAITAEELRSFRPSVANRLDRNTSGIVLCGKSLAGSQALSRIIKERSLQKYYHTVCAGDLDREQHLKGYLHKDEKSNKVTVREELPQDGREETYSPIETSYRPLRRNQRYTLLEVELITGKTHQIRSHLAFIGHPIIGDGKYGAQQSNRAFREEYSLKHQLLHAYRVVFPKEGGILAPLSGREVVAPYPRLFTRLVSDLFAET